MKKVVKVVTAPFRAIGRLLLKLLRNVRVLGKPFAKLAGLRGRTRIIVYGLIAVFIVLAVVVLKPGPAEEERVRATLDRYAEATRDKDYQTICDEIYASDLVERVRAAGLPCEVALRTGLDDRQNPRLQVLNVEVTGDQAAARVRSTAVNEPTSVDVVRLIDEDGDWRVESLTDPGAATPAP